MTVIACRDGILAADTAVWQGGIIAGHVQKIERLPDGRLAACSGPSPSVLACRAWLCERGPRPEPLPEGAFGGLILGPDGISRVSHRFEIYPSATLMEFAAEGSHIEFLLGAMAAGASAEQAVRLAIQLGDSAGGNVQVERL